MADRFINNGCHAWFSYKQAEVAGYRVHQRPDGTTYQVTTISDTTDHGCGWDDMKYLGVIGPDDTSLGQYEATDPLQAMLNRAADEAWNDAALNYYEEMGWD